MDSSSASTSITVTLSNSVKEAAVDVCEYSGLNIANLVDRTQTNTHQLDDSSAIPDTGTTSTTSQANELWIGATMEYGDNWLATVQTGATNGFTLLDGQYTANYPMYGSLAYLEKMVTSTGQANSGTTPYSRPWAGCIATFRSAS